MKKSRNILTSPLFLMGLVVLFIAGCDEAIDTTTGVPMGTVADIDGNIYHTMSIGTQVWMVENLKTTKYRDGTNIVNEKDSSNWRKLTTPAYCWHNNDVTNKNTYGALYNWFAINSGNICPAGWHVPSDAEWTILINTLGGEAVAGGKLKEAGITHWRTPNSGATNESGFTALPGGYRDFAGVFGPATGTGSSGYFWSSTESSAIHAWYRSVDFPDAAVVRFEFLKTNGFSIRCIKD